MLDRILGDESDMKAIHLTGRYITSRPADNPILLVELLLLDQSIANTISNRYLNSLITRYYYRLLQEDFIEFIYIVISCFDGVLWSLNCLILDCASTAG